MTNTSSLRRSLGLAVLVLTLLSFAVPNAMATHLRGGTISWTPISGAAPGSHRIRFTVQEAQRWSYPGQYGMNPPLNTTGTVLNFSGLSIILPINGSGGQTQIDPAATVTSINSSEDWMTVSSTFTFDFFGCFNGTATLEGGNRLSTLELGHDSSEFVNTSINTCAVNGSPVAAVPAVLAVPLLPTTGFNLGPAVTDIDPTAHLSFRTATATEMLGTTAVACLNNNNTTTTMVPPGFTITTSGQVAWNTTAIAGGVCNFAVPKAGDLWAVQIIVEARDINNNILSSIPIDLMLKFVSPVGALPTITLNPAGPQTVTPGTPVTFAAVGNSINSGAKITLNANGVPVGAIATNLNQTLTPPVISSFSWTPTISQTGTVVVTYTVTDNNFQQATASETIIVAAAPPTATCSANFSLPYGQAGTVSANVFDASNEVLNVVFSLDGNPVQTFSNVVAYPNPATKSINQTYGPVGPHVVSVKATDPHGISGSCQTTVNVTKANQTITFAALPDVTYGTPDFGITATANSGLVVDFMATGACTVSGNTVHITGAGACSITASQPGDTNYNAAQNVTQTFNITQAQLTVTAGSYSGVYDGATHALSACTVSANFDNLSCTNNPAGPVGPDAGAGTIAPVVVGSTSNYIVTSNNGSWSITALAVKLTAGTYNGVYDGSSHAPSACASTYVGVTCTNNPGSVGPDVSSGAVAPVAAFSSGIAADYAITPTNGSWSITPLTVTITGGSYSGIYDGSSHSPSACTSTYTGVSCTNNPASMGPDVSNGAVAPVAAFNSGIAADYTLAPVNGSWSITPLTVTITGGSYTGTYDGGSHSPSACNSNFAGLTCTNNPASVGPNVGSGSIAPVAAYGSALPSDFTLMPVNGSWSIAPLTVTITAGSYSGTYDGNAHAPSACISNYVGLTCTNNLASVGPDVGSGSVAPVPSYGSAIATDFTLTPVNGSWSISQLTVSIVAGSYSGVYDGNPHAPSACASSFLGVSCTNSPSSVGPTVGSGTVSPIANINTGTAADYSLSATNGAWSISKVPSVVTLTCPANVTYTGQAQTPCTATVTGAGLNQSVPVTYQNNIIGTATATATFAGDASHSGSSATKTFNILYSTGSCLGGPGHTILQPINPDGSSVWKQGSTVPAKFRVCDATGNSVGAPGTVSSFSLVSIISGTITSVDEVPDSTTPDTVFRWTGDQWIFNISTKGLNAGSTYVYQIKLNDGSIIQFQYGLK